MTTNDKEPDQWSPSASENEELDMPIERDGVSSLHDVESESGDEQGLRDILAIDEREAEQMGVALDPVASDEPTLD